MTDSDPHGLASGLRPMLAVGGELPDDDAAWAYEMKWDGIRAIASVGGGQVRLFSRTGREVTATYPELQGLAAAAERDLVLDGEVVAFGADGWPSFETLQQRMNVASAELSSRMAADISVSLVVFDLLFADGRKLVDQPYRSRRAELDALGLEGPQWQTPPAFTGVAGAEVRAVSQRHRLEGIVAKRLASRYEPGKRSAAWRKIKNRFRQEVVVGGWRPGKEGRTGQIGSLLVGVQGPGGLLYAGHVGTGFTQETLAMLLGMLTPLRRPAPPFTGDIPADDGRDAVWTDPIVVIEVEFAGWTSAGRLRAASYLGLRTDKSPADVVREELCAGAVAAACAGRRRCLSWPAASSPRAPALARPQPPLPGPPFSHVRTRLATRIKTRERDGSAGSGAPGCTAASRPALPAWPAASGARMGSCTCPGRTRLPWRPPQGRTGRSPC